MKRSRWCPKVASLASAGIVLLALSSVTHAYPARVVAILDGDTLVAIADTHQQVRCRLYGIDAPEKSQAFGERSKQSLSELVFQKRVELTAVGSDQYGRTICRIAESGRDVNLTQVERGMAWVYRRFTSDRNYLAAEASARQALKGLWQDPMPIPPWAFRRAVRSDGQTMGNTK